MDNRSDVIDQFVEYMISDNTDQYDPVHFTIDKSGTADGSCKFTGIFDYKKARMQFVYRIVERNTANTRLSIGIDASESDSCPFSYSLTIAIPFDVQQSDFSTLEDWIESCRLVSSQDQLKTIIEICKAKSIHGVLEKFAKGNLSE